MYYCIYKITNLTTNKIYIGKHQTPDINDSYFGSGKLLKRAIRKYGIDNFSKEILFVFDTEEEMDAKEKELVTEEFCQLKTNYNLCVGGQGGFSYINREGKNGTSEGRSRGGSVSIQRRYEREAKDPEYKRKLSEARSEVMRRRHREGKINRSKYLNRRRVKDEKGVIHNSAKELAALLGINPTMITYYVKQGKYEYLD